MSAWSNIEVPPGDAEITGINKLEEAIGNYPEQVRKVRELITRFEVCHFKYLQHLKNIRKSIIDLHPFTDPGNIGQNHIQHGAEAWKSDKTGRSIMGQQYLWALHNWLDNNNKERLPEFNDQLTREVETWLGEKSQEKVKLVRLLLARLTWDWKTLEEVSQRSMEDISQQEDDMGLEYQIYRMDICHYSFPVHLINILRGIGEMKPLVKFEGCGTYNSHIKKSIRTELVTINDWLLSRETNGTGGLDQNEQIRIWLYACLAKTIKEQVGLKDKIAFP